MKRNGFVSTTLVISFVIMAMSLVLIIMRQFELTNFHAYNITQGARERLLNAKMPNCTWSPAPLMRRHNNHASGSIVLECFHVDGIRALPADICSSGQATRNTIANTWIQRTTEGAGNDAQFNVTVVNTSCEQIGGLNYSVRIVFALGTNTPGNYRLTLTAGTPAQPRIRTNDDFNNQALQSGLIRVQ